MNFKRILSKSSLKSSISSERNSALKDECNRIPSEIEILKQNVESLKIALEMKDAAIGDLAREKEKLYVELRSSKRTNRNLHQQIIDEREIHSKEKDYFIEELKKFTAGHPMITGDSFHSVNAKMKAKDEIIYNICTKYLKIKSYKTNLQKQMNKLKQENHMVNILKICEEIITSLEQNRETFDLLLDKLTDASTAANEQQYLKLLKINGRLHFENTQLKILMASSQIKHLRQIQEERESCNQVLEITKSRTSDKPIDYNDSARYKSIQPKSIFTNNSVTCTKEMQINIKRKRTHIGKNRYKKHNHVIFRSFSDPNIY